MPKSKKNKLVKIYENISISLYEGSLPPQGYIGVVTQKNQTLTSYLEMVKKGKAKLNLCIGNIADTFEIREFLVNQGIAAGLPDSDIGIHLIHTAKPDVSKSLSGFNQQTLPDYLIETIKHRTLSKWVAGFSVMPPDSDFKSVKALKFDNPLIGISMFPAVAPAKPPKEEQKAECTM